jgi:hypothetical protein
LKVRRLNINSTLYGFRAEKQMKHKSFFIVIIFAITLFLVSCAPSAPSTTATLPATDTPIPTETPTPTLAPPTPTPQTVFNVLDYSNCFAPGDGDGYKTFIEDEALNIVASGGVFSPCDGHEFSDLTFEADATLTDASTVDARYAILFRFNHQNWESFQYYELAVWGDEAVLAYADTRKTGDDWWTPLQDWVKIPELNEVDKVNHLKVVAVGGKIAAFVNNYLIGYIQDDSLTSGLVAFSLFNQGSAYEEQHVIFENMKIQITQP